MLRQLCLEIIVLLHFIFLMFLILVPFFGSNYLLVLHAITIPFMMAHWVLNDNNCALTLLEAYIRSSINGGIMSKEDCYVHRLVAPVYDFKKNNQDSSMFIYGITLSLWFVSLYRLYTNWKNGKLDSLEHFVLY